MEYRGLIIGQTDLSGTGELRWVLANEQGHILANCGSVEGIFIAAAIEGQFRQPPTAAHRACGGCGRDLGPAYTTRAALCADCREEMTADALHQAAVDRDREPHRWPSHRPAPSPLDPTAGAPRRPRAEVPLL